MRAETTQETDRGWRRIELRQLVFLNCLPVARGRRVNGGRLEDRGSDTVRQQSINDVAGERRMNVKNSARQVGHECTYVCPVTQPTSATQANLSSGWTSKTYLT